MYRGRNRSRRNDVKGPNSALTQFLKEEGISAEHIKKRWEKSQKKSKDGSVEGEDTEASFTKSEVSDVNSNTDISIIENDELDLDKPDGFTSVQRSYVDRFKSVGHDSDEEEYESSKASSGRLSTPNDEDNDAVVSSRRKRTKELLQSRKRKKKRAANLLNRQENVLPTLQNLCVLKITENISTWRSDSYNKKNLVFNHLRDVLGGISTANLNNLANALSRNRALDDETLQLFLKTDLTHLTFHDCSKISFDGYKTLAIFSPHLTSLSLQMCGQLNNEALLYLAEKLPNLNSLYLDGPFLVNEATWDEFFASMRGRLKEFYVSNTHRFVDKSLTSLLVNCHESLQSLGLSRLDSVFNYSLLPQYLINENFHTLAIEYPSNEEDVQDEVIINILGQVGRSLKNLTLRGCIELTDSMIINGMVAFLSGENSKNTTLKTLILDDLDQVTADSLVYFFSQVSLPCLEICSLRRCEKVGDMAIVELFLNAAKDSLKSLHLNSMKELTKEAFNVLNCPNLEYIDLGFVRCVDNHVVELLGNNNPKLKLMDVFGDNLVTEKAKIRDRLTVIGRQSDSI
ncbi:hypothetical protein KAFR_0I02820 [Kazachstania africana CBS 2517]|uniref:DNA repair protein RAD7 n=1 Tax=Kazachstania africana (strain ATCC 22294 / BCRC 22015 / CBS 2517 / CECT 1963 / NBRC 1671 / NRRL Y-8276) TaxID=1071382 RepID=H2B0B1_KAZAF|nr:hypothetical protein KAFR_0I02820 [Kazachstania africana CBS 2517]CCF60061.1 hypothetical protein KAFR_0I02820 [Kazachstania africana CBS 2517]